MAFDLISFDCDGVVVDARQRWPLGSWAVAMGDLDGDEPFDLVTCNLGGDRVTVLLDSGCPP